jgi:hypothetical protein
MKGMARSASMTTVTPATKVLFLLALKKLVGFFGK